MTGQGTLGQALGADDLLGDFGPGEYGGAFGIGAACSIWSLLPGVRAILSAVQHSYLLKPEPSKSKMPHPREAAKRRW